MNNNRKFVLKNKDDNLRNNFLIHKNKIYEKNKISEIESSRINFLSELITKENLNISKMDIIESNELFLNKNILPKIEKIKSKIVNSSFVNAKINKEKNSIDLNSNFLDYFILMNKTRNKVDYLYHDKKDKFTNDFTFIFFPLANLIHELHTNKTDNVPFIIGLQAHPGCGKTTLSNIISDVLNTYYKVNCNYLSIDDLYKKHKELNELKIKNPLFEYRGPPGTHDLEILNSIFNKIKEKENNYYLPRYNKSLNNGLGDRNDMGLFVKNPIDILIFEGWFLGANPIYEEKSGIINQIFEDKKFLNNQKKKDLMLQSNENLKDYVKYWNMIDFYISIKPEDFRLSRKWRIEAEKKNKNGMNWNTINKFIDYFWMSLPPEFYLDNLEDYSKPSVRMIINKNREFYI